MPWDIFFEGDRTAIDAWRKTNWKGIKTALRVEFGLEVPDGLEPHWTDPGTALFYTMDKTVTFNKSEGGRHNLQGFEEIDSGQWVLTSPMPVGNAQQLSNYLGKKGFRLRPPLEGVDGSLKTVVESAVAPEADPEYLFKCKTHGTEFLTWKAYLQHCRWKREYADLAQMPEEIQGTVGEHKYYCATHNFGTFNPRAAIAHRKNYLRIPIPGQHSTLEQMTVKRPAQAAEAKEKA